MATHEGFALARLAKLLRGVLPHGLQQAVPSIAGFLLDVDERFVDQPAEQCRAPRRVRSGSSAQTVLDRLQAEAPGEDREAPQQDLLLGVEQLEAPVQRRSQRLLARSSPCGCRR